MNHVILPQTIFWDFSLIKPQTSWWPWVAIASGQRWELTSSRSEFLERSLILLTIPCKSLSHVWLFAVSWTVTRHAPLFIEFSRQEYQSGSYFFLQEIFWTQGLNPSLLHCRQILYHLSHRGSPLFLVDIIPWTAIQVLRGQGALPRQRL